MKKIISATLVVLVVVIGALIWYFSPLNAEPNIWPKESFSSANWKAAPAQERYRQVRDLLDKNTLTGQTAVQIESMLGRPSYASPDNSYWTYIVKERSSGDAGFDAVKMLHIDFVQGRVTKAWIRGD